jgi:hypothetical protein
MKFEDRIAAFEKLGKYLNAIDEAGFTQVAQKARNENSWFTEQSIRQAIKGAARYLTNDRLAKWLSGYDFSDRKPRVVAVVMAGNIPLVGFHDLLCILISGHHIQIKLSSKDTTLLTFILKTLTTLEPRFKGAISIVDRLKDFDAVIATGSDNSARYFEYYFSKYPAIIRKNRTSVAILTGFESEEELFTLGADVFSYFGLGCRNVSKIFIPEGYEFPKLLKCWQPYEEVLIHHKYHNNYDYQKSILLVNRVHHFDNGFVLLQQSEKLVSPIAVLYYEVYKNWESLLSTLKTNESKIQAIVGNAKPATVKIGQAQSPEVWDYADQIDTLKFLQELN